MELNEKCNNMDNRLAQVLKKYIISRGLNSIVTES